MSRAQTRARRRRARIEQAGADFAKARNNPAALWALLTHLSDTDQPLWKVAEAASRHKPLDDTERAMVAQAVAPHLAGMTPGSVHWKRAHGRSPDESEPQSANPQGAAHVTPDAQTGHLPARQDH